MGGIHTASNVCNEADSALVEIWTIAKAQKLLIRGYCASGATLALPG